MSVTFANVTDIKIPEGNVTKIAETTTGRVLWEKKRYPDISLSWMRVSSAIGFLPDLSTPPIKKIVKSDEISDTNAIDKNIRDKVKDVKTRTMNTLVCLQMDFDFAERNRLRPVAAAICEDNGETYCGVFANPFASGGKEIEGDMLLGASDWDYHRDRGFAIIKTKHSQKYGLNIYDLYPPYDTEGLEKELNAIPNSNGNVWTAYSISRDEILVTGLSGQLCVVKGANAIITYQTSSLLRTKWVEELGLYFGATGADGNISYSADGLSWTVATVFSSGYVRGVEWLSEKKKLCAINSNKAQIALSSDGKIWEVKTTPFTNALAYAYSPDFDVLCVVTNKNAYATRDLINWVHLSTPNNETINFHDIVHIGHGVFIGYEYNGTKAYILSTTYPLKNISYQYSSIYHGLIEV